MFLDRASCKSDSSFLMLFSRFSSSGEVVWVWSRVSVGRFDADASDVIVVIVVVAIGVVFDVDGWSFVEKPCMTSWNCSSAR